MALDLDAYTIHNSNAASIDSNDEVKIFSERPLSVYTGGIFSPRQQYYDVRDHPNICTEVYNPAEVQRLKRKI